MENCWLIGGSLVEGDSKMVGAGKILSPRRETTSKEKK